MITKYCQEWERKVAAVRKWAASWKRQARWERACNLEAQAVTKRQIARADDLQAQVDRLTYERDRARMMADSSGSLAEYRMRQIFALQAEISNLKGEAL